MSHATCVKGDNCCCGKALGKIHDWKAEDGVSAQQNVETDAEKNKFIVMRANK